MDIWNTIVIWLHGIGLHLDKDTAQTVGQAADQVGQAAGQMGQAMAQWDWGQLMALAAALGWASGFRLYAVVFVTGMLGATDVLHLPGGLSVLQQPVILFISGALLFVEFFADKIPGVDSAWDVVQSVVRVPAGAALAASVFGTDNATMATAAALMGGTLALSSQVAKTTTRAAINTSPEPFSNWGASLLEDGVSIGAVWLAINHPLVFAIALAVVLVLMWVMTWVLWKFLRAVVRRIRRWLGHEEPVALAATGADHQRY
ncbi:DUF4126 domain-containing protein [Comamonas piscis]|uniref:DUF4126 domain-containing protein n=1 Tax=Comamonas piscis TaxID=1562974 RepID=A0A7G5EMU8_9BURK|nr:DUF4126 domain-containing protein [Comamonas piscis]QMV75323.1 DUF4126 domain-containing protein [Comamonas piscis]WSO33820.1 DUF4126 domain-containing protein [Comamonas piscis]